MEMRKINKDEFQTVKVSKEHTEDYHTDYSYYKKNIRKWDEVLKEIDDFQKEINSYKI